MSTSVTLEDSELLLLDGHCSPSVQQTVNSAKQRLSMAQALPNVDPKLAGFIADVVSEAWNNNALVHQHTRLRSCPICGQKAGYYVYDRWSRNHRKGEPNYDKPKYLSGVELADRFIRMTGYASLGCCNSCFEKAIPFLKEKLKGVPAEIPEALTGEKPKFKRYKRSKCKKCGWTGHEGEMRKLRTIMGDGYYPGGCPKCDNESSLFNQSFESLDGYEIVEVKNQDLTPATP